MSKHDNSRKKSEQRPRLAERLLGPAAVLAAAGLAVWPLMRMGPSCGPDFGFHFVNWIEAQRSWLAGIPYPHWTNGPNYGAGEPRFVFYPPLTWMAGALLGTMVPWHAVSILFIYLVLVATGFATRALARQMLANGPATLAGCASIFLGTLPVDFLLRSDYAEFTGGFWIPLLLLFQLRKTAAAGTPLQRALAGTVPLSLVVAGIWLTNGPLGIMASYLLAATAILVAAMERSWAPLARAAASSALGGALAAFYLVPAVWERSAANIGAAIGRREYVIENGWLFSHHPGLSWSHFNTMLNIHSWIAVGSIVVGAAALGLAWMRGKLTAEQSWWLPLAIIPFAVLFLQFPVSDPLWKWLPALRYLQFPWRWMIVMNAPVAIFFAAAVWVTRPLGKFVVLCACAMLFFIIIGSTWGICFENCYGLDAAILKVEPVVGIDGKPEYAPQGIRYTYLDRNVTANCAVGSLEDVSNYAASLPGVLFRHDAPICTGNFTLMANQPEHKVFVGTADRAGYLILHLRSFPAWRVTVNNRAASPVLENGFGLMAVPIPQGSTMVTVDWTTTPDVWLGRGLSALALLLLTALCALERRWTRGRLSLDECQPTSNR